MAVAVLLGRIGKTVVHKGTTSNANDQPTAATPEDQRERYIDRCFERMKNVRHIRDVIVMNDEGIPLRTTIADEQTSLVTAGLYESLKIKSSYFLKLLNPTDEFLMVRVKTKNNEAIIATDPDHGLLMIAVQVPE